MFKQEKVGEFLLSGSASKIFTELNKLRNSGTELMNTFRKRWIWELLQNATDCCDIGQTIDIKINFNNSQLEFSHNGKGFTEDNLWSMITQFSKKASNEDTTGKFGTGFISTTLISPYIQVTSYREETSRPFSLRLDRSAVSIESLSDSIKKELEQVEKITNENPLDEHINRKKESTTFKYDLDSLQEEDKKKVCKSIEDTLAELTDNIGYILVFNTKINSIIINMEKFSKNIVDTKENRYVYNIIKNEQVSTDTILNIKKNEWEVAIPCSFTDGHIVYKPINLNTPRLFCSFALIGTEKFPLPVVLNSIKFNVEIDRNGILEGDKKNNEIIEETLLFYDQLLNSLEKKENLKIFNICKFERVQDSEYKTNLKEQIDKIIFSKNIVLTSSGEFKTIRSSKNNKQILIPKEIKGENTDKLWELVSKFPSVSIPVKDEFKEWSSIIDNDLTVDRLNKNIIKSETLGKFQQKFFSDASQNYSTAINWLNDYYKYIETVGHDIQFVMPDLSQKFRNSQNLFLANNVIPELLNIYIEKFPQKKGEIVSTNILVSPTMLNKMKSLSNNSIGEELSKEITNYLYQDNSRTDKVESFFERILNLFKNTQEDWNNIFPAVYPNRSKLRSKNFNEELSKIGDLIVESNISSEIIKEILSNREFIESIVATDEIDGKIIEQFLHINSKSIYAKEKIDQLIERSVKNVYKFLKKNERYTVPDTLEQWSEKKISKTIFTALKDSETDKLIVIRPSDGDKIIFYEEQELSALDSNEYELWTDNGIDGQIRQITLGDILKTTKINTIPLKNLFEEKQNDYNS